MNFEFQKVEKVTSAGGFATPSGTLKISNKSITIARQDLQAFQVVFEKGDVKAVGLNLYYDQRSQAIKIEDNPDFATCSCRARVKNATSAWGAPIPKKLRDLHPIRGEYRLIPGTEYIYQLVR